jgi:hypothetical protein
MIMDLLHQLTGRGMVLVVQGLAATWLLLQFVEKFFSSKATLQIRLAMLRSFTELLDGISVTRDPGTAPRGLLIDMCMPPDRADDVIYNLLCRYDHWVEKHGLRWARIIFFMQSAGSIGHFLG